MVRGRCTLAGDEARISSDTASLLVFKAGLQRQVYGERRMYLSR